MNEFHRSYIHTHRIPTEELNRLLAAAAKAQTEATGTLSKENVKKLEVGHVSSLRDQALTNYHFDSSVHKDEASNPDPLLRITGSRRAREDQAFPGNSYSHQEHETYRTPRNNLVSIHDPTIPSGISLAVADYTDDEKRRDAVVQQEQDRHNQMGMLRKLFHRVPKSDDLPVDSALIRRHYFSIIPKNQDASAFLAYEHLKDSTSHNVKQLNPMNKQAFIQGFVKRAQQHGIPSTQALELLKTSSFYNQLKDALTGSQGSGIGDKLHDAGATARTMLADGKRLYGNAAQDALEDAKYHAQFLWHAPSTMEQLRHHGGVALRPVRDFMGDLGAQDLLADVAPAAGVGAAGLGAYGLYKLLHKKQHKKTDSHE